MSSVETWLAAREPAPPGPLAEALTALLAQRSRRASTDDATGAREDGLTEALTARAREVLEHAVACPGRERESAYRLLEADALFTYACEAALEEVDSESSIRRVLAFASRSR